MATYKIKRKQKAQKQSEDLGFRKSGFKRLFAATATATAFRSQQMTSNSTEMFEEESSSYSEDEEAENWDDWIADDEDENGGGGGGYKRGAFAESGTCITCLFCDAEFGASDASSLFDHCARVHSFDFGSIRIELGLDFYGSFKLLNYVRSRVAENRCWSCGEKYDLNRDLLNHLHEGIGSEEVRQCLDGDSYLKPFLQKDPLLYSFDQDEEDDEEDGDDYSKFVIKEEIAQDCLNQIEGISFLDGNSVEEPSASGCIVSPGKNRVNSASNYIVGPTCSGTNGCSSVGKSIPNNLPAGGALASRNENKQGKIGVKMLVAANSIRSVNENYFGAYSSFGIHREMLSDKVRMEAYSQAILKNPSLFSDAVVMDVGCGTGILSLFAARAGASRVIAVEASEKMAAVASQIAKNNGLWKSGSLDGDGCHGVVEVVHTMVEDLIDSKQIQAHSIDVLVSEWMGYCLLYESMLSSVLLARDQWLKPGGAILPDTATIYAAGFGKGATSIPFWEDVYGFDMSSVGKEILDDSARNPIVDVVSNSDLVTDSVILQNFDLVTMKSDEVDFTATVEIGLKKTIHPDGTNTGTTWCYGLVLWFETGFTERFCKAFATVLSTSPFKPKTHWAQTILTFSEPIAMSVEMDCGGKEAAVGTGACPAVKIGLRVSIARAPEHRSIDITVEPTAISANGRKRNFPLQIFNLQ